MLISCFLRNRNFCGVKGVGIVLDELMLLLLVIVFGFFLFVAVFVLIALIIIRVARRDASEESALNAICKNDRLFSRLFFILNSIKL